MKNSSTCAIVFVPAILLAVFGILGIIYGLKAKEAYGDNDDANLFDGSRCLPGERRPLDTFDQWREEEGYWIGELSFYQGDGQFNQPTSDFNYPYNSYKGFITGSLIDDFSYRQRNVFVYPPQTEEGCLVDSSVTGNGTCGVNGNTRLFQADQTASATDDCGTVSGPFAPGIDTVTTLVGDDNALLYQVFFGGQLFQSQLTTLTTSSSSSDDLNGTTTVEYRRTRSAQSFSNGVPTSVSFYRERRVSEDEFYAELEAALLENNVLDSDACTTSGFGGGPTGYAGGLDDCIAHLEESFATGR